MQRQFRQFARNLGRDGGLAASLPFVVATVALGLLSWSGTEWAFSSRDTLAAYAPSHTQSYVHARGERASAVLLASSPVPMTAVRPYEAAVFTVSGDDEPREAVLLSWRRWTGPSEEDAAAIVGAGGSKLDDRTYIFGDVTVQAAARLARASGKSVATDAARASALRTAAKYFALQAVVPPRAIILGADDAAHALLDRIIPAEPLVIGANFSEDSYHARVAALSAMWQFGMPRDPRSPVAPDMSAVESDVALAELRPSIDIARLLPFASDYPVAAAEDAFRQAVDRPYVLWLRQDSGDFLLHFPDADWRSLAQSVRSLEAAHYPDSVPIELPDGETVTELVMKPAVVPMDEDVAVSTDEGITVSSDGKGGAFMSSTSALSSTPSEESPNRELMRCRPGMSQLRISPVSAIRNPIFSALLSKGTSYPMLFTSDVNNIIEICGYY